MKVSVVGLGYVGLPLAIRLSLLKHSVVGIDKNLGKINLLRIGKLPFAQDEPHLKEYFKKSKKQNNLKFTNSFEGLKTSEIIFVCVDTPVVAQKPDYHSLFSAIKSISKYLSASQIIVLESTIAPKTTRDLIVPTIEKNTGKKLNNDFFVAVAPERIRPNYIFKQLTTLPRIIGVSQEKIIPKLKKVYSQITSGDLDFTDLLTAEVAKTVENTYRDVQIAFVNEIALACEELGVNVWEVRRLVNKDPFKDIHRPGAGVGGHCIPKDPWLLVSSLRRAKLNLIKNARNINDSMPNHILDLLKSAIKLKGQNLKKTTVVVFGYSYVEDSDDTRNSPTQSLVELLTKNKISFKIHDPFVPQYKKIDPYQLLTKSDALVIMVKHTNYKKLNLSEIASLMRTKIIIDGRNLIDKKKAEAVGFLYKGVGNV